MTGTRPGTLLGGRIPYDQGGAEYRTGIEPVLLAAAIPARPGDQVLEGGTGAGAGLLCLAARVPGIAGIGIENDPDQAARAAANFAASAAASSLRAEAADLLAWRPDPPVLDHAFANPPWHDPAGTPSPAAGRRAAKRAGAGLLHAWCAALARPLRPRGTLSLILPASSLGEAMDALRAARCAEIAVLPLWPREGQAARLVILQAVRLGRGPCLILPGLALHHPSGGYTAAAEAVLRDAAPLGAAARLRDR